MRTTLSITGKKFLLFSFLSRLRTRSAIPSRKWTTPSDYFVPADTSREQAEVHFQEACRLAATATATAAINADPTDVLEGQYFEAAIAEFEAGLALDIQSKELSMRLRRGLDNCTAELTELQEKKAEVRECVSCVCLGLQKQMAKWSV